jgi:hypothetical protein
VAYVIFEAAPLWPNRNVWSISSAGQLRMRKIAAKVLSMLDEMETKSTSVDVVYCFIVSSPSPLMARLSVL